MLKKESVSLPLPSTTCGKRCCHVLPSVPRGSAWANAKFSKHVTGQKEPLGKPIQCARLSLFAILKCSWPNEQRTLKSVTYVHRTSEGNFQKAEVLLSTDYYQGVCSSVPFRDQMQWVAGLLLERPTNPGYLRRKESDPEVKVSVSGFIANLVRLILVYPVEASEILRLSGRSVSRFHCLKPSQHCLQGSVEDHHILWNLQCHSELW